PVKVVVRRGDKEEVALPVKTIRSIDPGQVKRIQFSYVFSTRGSYVIEAKLPADDLIGDNSTYLALEVRKSRRILIVDGEPDITNPINSESYFLVQALDPMGDERYGNKPEVISLEQLPDANLNQYDVVILANVRSLPMSPSATRAAEYPLLKALSEYVRSGGGLAIFTGDRIDISFYNGPFYDQGVGLCPAKLALPIGQGGDRKTFVRLKRDSIASDWVMRAFHGERSLCAELIRFYRFNPVVQTGMSVAANQIGPVKILARFNNSGEAGIAPNSPAILTRAFGQGTVMMICSSADKEWNDWPKDITYVPFVNDMVRFLLRPSGGEFTARVNQPIDYTLGEELSSASATLKTPAFPLQDTITLEVRRKGIRRSVFYADTIYKGIYELELSHAQEVHKLFFARNINPDEGRLSRVSKQELQGRLGVKFDYRDRLKPKVEQVAEASKQEYWKLALDAMLVVLAAEVFLGQRFGHYR
ncbi:MAG: hypothetical protein J7L99_01300, partial [Planctomycetes bacterium]|nr:hypothetical protein [Planctomycetota bacterium]